MVEKSQKNGCPVGGAAIGSCSHSDCSPRGRLTLPGPWREGRSQAGISPAALQSPGKPHWEPEVREFGTAVCRGQLLWARRRRVRMDLRQDKEDKPEWPAYL